MLGRLDHFGKRPINLLFSVVDIVKRMIEQIEKSFVFLADGKWSDGAGHLKIATFDLTISENSGSHSNTFFAFTVVWNAFRYRQRCFMRSDSAMRFEILFPLGTLR